MLLPLWAYFEPERNYPNNRSIGNIGMQVRCLRNVPYRHERCQNVILFVHKMERKAKDTIVDLCLMGLNPSESRFYISHQLIFFLFIHVRDEGMR